MKTATNSLALPENLLGHNAAGIEVSVEVRMYNSVSRYSGGEGIKRNLSLPAGSDIADILRTLAIPAEAVFLIFVNGRDITPMLNQGVRTSYVIEEGDMIALSGPVPYSWAYGAPVV